MELALKAQFLRAEASRDILKFKVSEMAIAGSELTQQDGRGKKTANLV